MVKLDDKKIAEEILTTRGVNSKVIDEGIENFHVGLYDFDNAISKSDLLCKVMDLEGINILWLSSDDGIRKYHLWNLTCKSKEEILQDGALLGSDCKHVTHGYRQGKWVLRISPKWANGEKYKDSPKLLHTWCNCTTQPQSIPHFKLFMALTGKTIFENDCFNWIGRSAQIETYMTITDKMKLAIK